MPFLLSESQIHEVLSLPETGMGFQWADVAVDHSRAQGFILNAELFVPDSRLEKISGPHMLTYSAILKEAEKPGLIRDIHVLSRGDFRETLGTLTFAKRSQSALESQIQATGKDDIFKRFSAYKNDRRVTPDGGLRPGSYATTKEDARNVRTGTEAILRYAIPNDEPAVFRFTIHPPQLTLIRIGIVQPVPPKPGGGVEVLFEKGSPKSTVTGPDQIPER